MLSSRNRARSVRTGVGEGIPAHSGSAARGSWVAVGVMGRLPERGGLSVIVVRGWVCRKPLPGFRRALAVRNDLSTDTRWGRRADRVPDRQAGVAAFPRSVPRLAREECHEPG